jgi:hypothetical protein
MFLQFVLMEDMIGVEFALPVLFFIRELALLEVV